MATITKRKKRHLGNSVPLLGRSCWPRTFPSIFGISAAESGWKFGSKFSVSSREFWVSGALLTNPSYTRWQSPRRCASVFDIVPPSAELLPPAKALRERLAVALREVSLLRRLIRAAESVRPHPLTTADQLPALNTSPE